ncbi:MAG: DUF3422 domain-containing protein [Nitrospiraceae bacterium]|nr:DUF3422 domain-containing protein [Nitrospiraceae bacterium]
MTDKLILKEHAQRRQFVSEMHLRRWPEICAPTEIIQILRLVSEQNDKLDQSAIGDLPTGSRLDEADNSKHVSGTMPGGIAFTIEFHTEASLVTLFAPTFAGKETSFFGGEGAAGDALAWAARLPGDVLRATRITVVKNEADGEKLLENFNFRPDDLVSCRVGNSARVWSDFRIGDDAFGRLVIAANEVSCHELSRLIQRLQELGNYRNLALLGLPAAQQSWPTLTNLEQQLVSLASDVSKPEISDDQLLDRVSELSMELIQLSTATSYRMSATTAYARLVEERLADVDVVSIAGFLSLEDFTQRRFRPAVRTCAAHTSREAELSLRAERFASLLRTRIETRIENQNARLLLSMEKSSTLQLRLQQLVEGLSVVALSYYVIGLIGYATKGIGIVSSSPHYELVLSLFTIIVVFGVWRIVHVAKQTLFKAAESKH